MNRPVDLASSSESASELELVARLMRVAGTRVQPPVDDYEFVFAAATAALDAKLAQRRRKRVIWPVAMAASLVAAIAGLLTILPKSSSEPAVARPQRLAGDVTVRAPGESLWRPMTLDASIVTDSSIRTGPNGRAALRLGAGPALRLDADSEVLLESDRRVRLLRGAAYVDSGFEPANRLAATVHPVEIVTSQATAREIGTQFEVRLFDDQYRLRVREGRVVLARADGQFSGGAGEQLVIGATGHVVRGRVSSVDPDWRWVEAIASAPEIENESLSLVLAWVARETGRAIRYSSPETEQRAAAAILHGSIRGLDPLAALETVLATSELGYRIVDDGSILISQL